MNVLEVDVIGGDGSFSIDCDSDGITRLFESETVGNAGRNEGMLEVHGDRLGDFLTVGLSLGFTWEGSRSGGFEEIVGNRGLGGLALSRMREVPHRWDAQRPTGGIGEIESLVSKQRGARPAAKSSGKYEQVIGLLIGD
jgi:hypothetical protein